MHLDDIAFDLHAAHAHLGHRVGPRLRLRRHLLQAVHRDVLLLQIALFSGASERLLRRRRSALMDAILVLFVGCGSYTPTALRPSGTPFPSFFH